MTELSSGGIKTYSDQIIDYIKTALLKGEMMPGDKVNEVRLAAALSISRAPVREALLGLVKEGLIDNIPQRGKFIRSLSAKEIKDSYCVGGVLEGAAVSESAELLTDGDFDALDQLVGDMTALQSGSPTYAEDLARLDMAFHVRLLSKHPNRLMGEYARLVCRRISRFLLFRHWPSVYTPEEIVLRHGKVLEAVRSRDKARIERAIRDHYYELGDRMSRFGSDAIQGRAS